MLRLKAGAISAKGALCLLGIFNPNAAPVPNVVLCVDDHARIIFRAEDFPAHRLTPYPLPALRFNGLKCSIDAPLPPSMRPLEVRMRH